MKNVPLRKYLLLFACKLSLNKHSFTDNPAKVKKTYLWPFKIISDTLGKAMCLPNFFGILQKSKVKSQILSTVENVPKIYWTFLVLNFAKMYQNFQKLTVYVKNRRSLYQKF